LTAFSLGRVIRELKLAHDFIDTTVTALVNKSRDVPVFDGVDTRFARAGRAGKVVLWCGVLLLAVGFCLQAWSVYLMADGSTKAPAVGAADMQAAGHEANLTPLDNLGWQPQLDQPIQQLEETLAATSQQQPMNYAAANLSFVYDAKLYLAFERHLATVPANRRNACMEEQRRWMEARRRRTDEAYSEYKGGTLASLSGSQAFIEMTKRRIKDIEGGDAQADVPDPRAQAGCRQQ
jgi:uncharacterized protein YecT (DUF1311 family)